MDLKLDGDHDLLFENNDLALTETESESLAQRLVIKLKTFQGEWFLDQFEGIPYFQSILGKNRSKEAIDAIFKAAITNEPEVQSLNSYQSSVDVFSRGMTVEFEVQSVNDDEPTLIETQIGG